jgi:putative flippase GtrA
VNALARFAKFSMVGALGTALQLTAVALLSRIAHGHYLVATAIALELSLLHNFAWHSWFTWRDRSSGWRQFLRFHAANGIVSMLGNLVLVGFFVSSAGLPVVMANLIAIGCCGVVNYWIGNQWVFGRRNANL